jgi:hypothetical protein
MQETGGSVRSATGEVALASWPERCLKMPIRCSRDTLALLSLLRWLYEDDGISYSYLEGELAAAHIRCPGDAAGVTLEIRVPGSSDLARRIPCDCPGYALSGSTSCRTVS